MAALIQTVNVIFFTRGPTSEAQGAPFLLMGFGAMRRQPPTVYTDPAKVVTLEVEIPPDDDVAGPTRRVLVLEDRDDFREVLREHLVFRRFQVTSVPSGVEGLREIMKDAFDLIICDMLMPRMGGEMFYWAVTRYDRLRLNGSFLLPATRTIPPLIFSSSG